MIKSIHTRRDASKESGDIKADDGRKKKYSSVFMQLHQIILQKHVLYLVLCKPKEKTIFLH